MLRLFKLHKMAFGVEGLGKYSEELYVQIRDLLYQYPQSGQVNPKALQDEKAINGAKLVHIMTLCLALPQDKFT